MFNLIEYIFIQVQGIILKSEKWWSHSRCYHGINEKKIHVWRKILWGRDFEGW